MKREEKQKLIEQRILKAILKKMNEKDFDHITSNEIAEAANISKRTLYKYFSSKTEMYLRLVKDSFVELFKNTDEAIGKMQDNNAVNLVECIGISYLKFILNEPIKGRLITKFNENEYKEDYPEQIAEIVKVSDQYTLRDFVRYAYESNGVEPTVSIEATVMFLWSTILGLGSLLLSKKDWIKEFYNIEEDRLVKEVFVLLKQTLGEKDAVES